jgi:hypothetical protein
MFFGHDLNFNAEVKLLVRFHLFGTIIHDLNLQIEISFRLETTSEMKTSDSTISLHLNLVSFIAFHVVIDIFLNNKNCK